MKKFFPLILTLTLTLLLLPSGYVACAESPKTHIDLGNKHLINDRPFAAVEEFKLAIERGANDPILYRNLSIILYDLGFLDEAVDYMKRALSISPYANSFQMELGIIYLAKGDYEKARHEFMEVLRRNPGFSNAYFYIGETFFRTHEYDMAWMFAETAKQLKHKSSDLLRKLGSVSKSPQIRAWEQAGENLLIRQILVDTRSRADEIVKRIQEGELFEDVANEIDKTLNSVGGFLGHFKQSELHPTILKALSKQGVFSDPVIVETELGFHIVQRIVSFDFDLWKQVLADYRKSKQMNAASLEPSTPEKTGPPAAPVMESKISKNVTLVSNYKAPKEKPAGEEQSAAKKPSDTKKYLVFSGAFSEEKNALERNARLQTIGLPSYIHQQRSSGGLVHMVIAGKFDTLQQAREAGKTIAKHGIDYFISP